MRASLLMTLVACITLTSCTALPNDREMNYQASALTKLSAAVDVTVKYKNPPSDITESELLAVSVAHDKSLIVPFKNQIVRVIREGKRSAVLICDSKTARPLLEDAGCTSKLDYARWQDSLPNTCSFTLDLVTTCGR